MRCYECLHHDHCDMEFLPRTKTCFKPKSAQSSTLDAGGSVDRVSIDRNLLKALCLTADAVMRKPNDKRKAKLKSLFDKVHMDVALNGQ